MSKNFVTVKKIDTGPPMVTNATSAQARSGRGDHNGFDNWAELPSVGGEGQASSAQSQPFELRGYQREAVAGVRKSWSQFDRCLGISPTGSGKTIIFAEITEKRLAKGGRVLILAHRDELIDQAIDKLYKARGLRAAKEKAADRADLDAGIVVASVQTLARTKRLQRFPLDHFNTMIVDEAHHILAETYQRIFRHLQSDKTLGVTATPDRGDTRNLGRFFEDIAFEIGLVDLMKAGFLCPIKVRTVPVKIDISNVSTRAGDFSEEELAEALEPVLEKIAEAVIAYAKNRKTLVFVPLIRIADQFAGILKENGLAAEMICGICTDRAEKLARFSSGETQILVNAMLLGEGYDEPSIDGVIVLRPTKIRSFYAQMVGRGTRIHPGKIDLLLLDFLWISRQHDLAKPASLISHDENEQTALEMVLEEGGEDVEGDLVAALHESHERALARQILAQKKLKGEVRDLLDIIDLCVAYKAPELEGYAPTMHWHVRELSPKQIDFLKRYRVDLSVVQNRGHAFAIIDVIKRYNESIPATAKQLNYLYYLGYRGETAGFSKAGASRLIAQLKAQVGVAGYG
jgi:superfamily II DNA or RNA helicase